VAGTFPERVQAWVFIDFYAHRMGRRWAERQRVGIGDAAFLSGLVPALQASILLGRGTRAYALRYRMSPRWGWWGVMIRDRRVGGVRDSVAVAEEIRNGVVTMHVHDTIETFPPESDCGYTALGYRPCPSKPIDAMPPPT